jgi:hypothetical protein
MPASRYSLLFSYVDNQLQEIKNEGILSSSGNAG